MNIHFGVHLLVEPLQTSLENQYILGLAHNLIY